jgi:hypothetical protein
MSDVLAGNIYGRALSEAVSELGIVKGELNKLSKRKAQLEAFIANTEPLVPESLPTLQFPEPPIAETTIAPVRLPAQPIWKSILLSINGKGDSFTVKDALQGLERIGRPIVSPNKFQIVRAVLTKKTDNFEQIGPGLFCMKKAGREKEASSEEKAS